MSEMCIEIDSFGFLEVLADKFFGVQMVCFLINFLIGMEIMLEFLICVLGIVKCFVVFVNKCLDNLELELVDVIVQVVLEVVEGKLNDYFLFLVWQIGFGIQLNMNINEVVFNCVIQILGGEVGFKDLVYLNDYVNCLQSFNDIFLIVMYIVVVEEIFYVLILVL